MKFDSWPGSAVEYFDRALQESHGNTVKKHMSGLLIHNDLGSSIRGEPSVFIP